jgi:hypothetical protein
LQEVTQAWQPTQTFRSMTRASCLARVSGASWTCRSWLGGDEIGDALARGAEPRTPGAPDMAATCGEVSAPRRAAPGACARARRTSRPGPVIGSELLMRPPANGSSSEIRWLSRKPLRDSSAPGARCQAPSSLADRVPGPHRAGLHRLAVTHHAAQLAPGLSTQHQPPSATPAACAVTGFTCR